MRSSIAPSRCIQLIKAQLCPGALEVRQCDVLSSPRARVEQAVELGRVVEQLVGTVPDGCESLYYDLGEILLEIAVALSFVVGFNAGYRLARHRRVDVEQISNGRLVPGGQDLRPRVRLGAADLLPYRVRVVEYGNVTTRPRGALALLLFGSVERHYPRSGRGDHGLRHDEGLPVEVVEPPRERPHELEVLPLVFAYGHEVRVIKEHVSGLQHGVVEETCARRFDPTFPRLVLKLCHARELPKARHTVEQPAKLRMPADLALAEDHTPLGVEARGEVYSRYLPDLLPQYLRVLGHGDRVQVHDAEVVLVFVLHRHPVLERPHIVAHMQVAARLYPAEYSLFALHERYSNGLGGSWAAQLPPSIGDLEHPDLSQGMYPSLRSSSAMILCPELFG